jgi:ribose transport system permease protein
MKEVVLKHRKKYSLKEIRMKVGENNFQIMSILSGLLIMMLVFSFNSKYFFTSNNLLTIALQTSMIAIIALGQTFVLITAGIDLSIGSNMAIAGVISAMALKSGMPIGIAIILGLLAGVLVGLINGSLIAYGGLPPFVVTLGSMSIVKGIALFITGGIPVTRLSKSFNVIGNNKIAGIPIPVIITIGLTLLFGFILSKTKLGTRIFAVGSNLEAAKYSGINTKRTIIIVYVFSGLLAAVAGIIMASRIASGQPTAGTGYELYAVAASVIGGVSLAGGEGLLTGTLIGALIIGVLRNGLNLLSVSAFIQEIMIGSVIIIAVFADRIKRK